MAPPIASPRRRSPPRRRSRPAARRRPGRRRCVAPVPQAGPRVSCAHAEGDRPACAARGSSRRDLQGTAFVSAGRRLVAIYNPTSGGGHFRRDVPLIVESLAALGFTVEEAPTQRPGHATVLAAKAVEAGAEVVCAIGGDGTVNEVVNGMAGSRAPLAVIPTGTVNVLALELGIPLDPPDACRLAALRTRHRRRSRPRRRPLLRAHGRRRRRRRRRLVAEPDAEARPA